LAAIVLASGANAWAQDITYTITNCRLQQMDISNNSTYWNVIGTIVTDGAQGPLAASDILQASFAMETPDGWWATVANAQVYLGAWTYDSSSNQNLTIGSLIATPTELLLPPPVATTNVGSVELSLSGATDNPGWVTGAITWARDYYPPGTYWGGSTVQGGDYDGIMRQQGGWDPRGFSSSLNYPEFGSSTNPPAPLLLAGNDPWVIATAQPVPEPATFTLVGTALLGLGGVVYLRRRGAKA
jgi:hypothetical protein